jgi:hypothetical protein
MFYLLILIILQETIFKPVNQLFTSNPNFDTIEQCEVYLPCER